MSASFQWRPAAIIGAATIAVWFAGGLITATSVGDWYQTLAKPPLNPPDWVFAPVWAALFVAMAVAGYRGWVRAAAARRKLVGGLYATQLGLNFLWSCLFFGLKAPVLALIEIVPFWVVLGIMVRVLRGIDRPAAYLFLAYTAWVTFAVYLNAGIVAFN